MNNTLKRILTLVTCLVMTASFTVSVAASNTNLENDIITDEVMLIIPIVTMLEEHGGLLFTTLLIGMALGVGGTLLVQHFIRKRNQK